MVKVEWSEPARDDLREIYRFIARDSPAAAKAFRQRLLDSDKQIAAHPDSGRVVPETGELTYREILVGNYRVQYRFRGEKAIIMLVIHGRRILPPAIGTGA